MVALHHLYLGISTLSFTTTTYSFLPTNTATRRHGGRKLVMGGSKGGKSDDEKSLDAGPFGKNKAKGGPRQFLTQVRE